MATNQFAKTLAFARHGAWMALVLGIVFLSSRGGWTQDAPPSPAQTSKTLRKAIDLYRSQDFEKAAEYFDYIKGVQQTLSPTDQKDFAEVSVSNAVALKGQQDGNAQLRLAEAALQQGRSQEAGALLKPLNSNQYLKPAERQQLSELNRKAQTPGSGATQPGKADARTLLTAGRDALKAGDLTMAEALANQADKATSTLPTWLQPWNDSPAKLRRDIQTAKEKQRPPVAAEVQPKNPDPAAGDANAKAGTSTSKFMGMNLWPFASGAASLGTPPKKESSSSKVDEMMARQIVKDGFIFLEANDLDKAQLLASKAKELNVTYAPNERTPDLLLHEIQRRKGGTAAKPADPVTAQPKPAQPAKDADPRVLLKQGRALLAQRKHEEADKLCAQALAANGRFGLFEDTPEKLRRDIQKVKQSADRDDSVKLLVDARKLLALGQLEEAEKKTYKAQQLHGPYGVFDFGDRPSKLLEEIEKAKVARGPVNPNDKQIVAKDKKADPPLAQKPTDPPVGIPAGIQLANKNRAIVMLREARELERQGMLMDAKQKALDARAMKAPFAPDEDSPDNVLLGLSAKCDRQIVTHLQQAAQQVADANDVQRFEKAQEQILRARKLAQAFELDTTRIDQTAHYVQQVATNKTVDSVGGQLPIELGPGVVKRAELDLPTGDPQKDEIRKLAREKLRHAQLELSYGKTAQARKMAEELYRAEYGIQEDVLKLIRSISAEEYNQQVLEAKRNFDTGIDSFIHKDHRQAMKIFEAIDPKMLPETHQARLRDIMATREMQPHLLAQSEKVYLPKTQIDEKAGPNPPPADPDKESLLDKAKRVEAVQFQALRQRGQESIRSAHDMYKENQKEEAIKTLNHYIDQIKLAGFDPAKANELRRLPEARIQQYRTMMAEDELKRIEKDGHFHGKFNDTGRQDKIRAHQKEIVAKMKLVKELMDQGKLKEALVEVKQVREIDPENSAALAANMIIATRIEQKRHDDAVHGNERVFLDNLNVGLGKVATTENPVLFDPERTKRRDRGSGAIPYELRDPKERAIDYRLRQPISLHFKDSPLQQAIKDLAVQSGIQIQPDYRALSDAKVNLESPLTISVENIEMKSALNLMLDQLKLTYIIHNQVLMITTEDKTKGRLVRVTYPIADLIVVVPDHPMPDVLNIKMAIERSMSPNGGFGNYATAPPYGMNAGMPVSSHGSGGLGGAFANQQTSGSQSQGGPQGSPPKDRSKEAMAEVLKGLIVNTVAKNTWADMGGNGDIQYFPFGMALVINQPQEVQEEVAQLLATLRKLQDLQISVELRAVLVSETFFERIGVDFDMNIRTPTSRGEQALVSGQFGNPPFIPRTADKLGGLISGLTSAGTLTPDLNIPLRNSTFNFTTPQFGGYQPEAGLSLGLAFLSDIQVFMFLEAVQGDRRAHIMQSPKLTVFNGQIANIGGFTLRPTVTGMTPLFLGNNQVVMSPQITPMPFGLGMVVQAVVSPDRRFIRLNVTPTLSQGIQDPAGAFVIAAAGSVPGVFDGGSPQPIFANNPLSVSVIPTITSLQIADTTVNVPDGGTVLLGGFKFLAEERTEYGPPVLSKIPYLSRLFRNVGWSRDGSTLIYLVTARVIMVEEEERIFLGEIPPIPGR